LKVEGLRLETSAVVVGNRVGDPPGVVNDHTALLAELLPASATTFQ